MLKAYAIGFVGAVLAILVAAGIWFVTQPTPAPGVLWDGTVYTSKQEFKDYLKANGRSYETWIARHPGAGRWEPTGEAPAPDQANGGWTARLPLAGLALAAACASLVLLRLARAPAATLARRMRRRSRRELSDGVPGAFEPTAVPWIELTTPPPGESVARAEEVSAGTDGTPHARLLRGGVLLALAAASFLVLSWASSSHVDGAQQNAVGAQNERRELPTAATANFAVTPAVDPAAREFVQSRSDVSRSVEIARIVIPLMLILLVEGELLSVAGRTEGRSFIAFGLPMLAVFAVLAYARLREYIG